MTITVTLGWWLVPPAMFTAWIIWLLIRHAEWREDALVFIGMGGVVWLYTLLVRFLP